MLICTAQTDADKHYHQITVCHFSEILQPHEHQFSTLIWQKRAPANSKTDRLHIELPKPDKVTDAVCLSAFISVE